MCETVLDKFFKIRKFIFDSDYPVNALDISKGTSYNIRTVQRHVMRMATEGLVGFRGDRQNSYVYYRLGGSHVD